MKKRGGFGEAILFFIILMIFSSVSKQNDKIADYPKNSKIIEKTPTITSAETPTPVQVEEISKYETEEECDTEEKMDTISIYNEEIFKNSCEEIDYNSIDKSFIGKSVTKEILFTSTEEEEYRCASTESYVEDYSGYQHVYAIYDIFDCRFDKSFPIHSNDVIRVYGVVTDIKMNYANGLYYPIIDMYYADYVREWGKSKENSKTANELTHERNAEKERIDAEEQYYNSLNSDYNGQTKNVTNMENLSEKEFKEKCDTMNFKDMVDSTEDLSGRYVKIHVKLTDHKVFNSEKGKRSRLNELVDVYDINNTIKFFLL